MRRFVSCLAGLAAVFPAVAGATAATNTATGGTSSSTATGGTSSSSAVGGTATGSAVGTGTGGSAGSVRSGDGYAVGLVQPPALAAGDAIESTSLSLGIAAYGQSRMAPSRELLELARFAAICGCIAPDELRNAALKRFPELVRAPAAAPDRATSDNYGAK